MNHFRLKIVFEKEGKDLKEQFWLKSEGAMTPVAPPVSTPMLLRVKKLIVHNQFNYSQQRPD